jgi:hypothetical protein
MNPNLRHARACAILAAVALAGAAWAQDGDPPGAGSGQQAQPASNGDLPGFAVQRDVYVPVDGTGHVSSNQYIVVERRVIIPGQAPGEGADSGSGSGAEPDASATPKLEVPTRFILVPQEDDSSGNGSGEGGGTR